MQEVWRKPIWFDTDIFASGTVHKPSLSSSTPASLDMGTRRTVQGSFSTWICPKCDSESSSLLYSYDWTTGVGSDRTEPRKIHGRDGVVLLVGRCYKCFEKAHEVVSHHPSILRQINVPSVIPFRLWSWTGFTSARINDIATMVVSGVSISTIESNLVLATVTQYSMKRKRFFELLGISTTTSGYEFPTYEQWSSLLPAAASSRHAISACFLSLFWENHLLFEKHTTTTDEDSWLSCDHTFASAGKLYCIQCIWN